MTAQKESLEQLQEENTSLNLEIEAFKKRLQDSGQEIEQLNIENKEHRDTIDGLIREMQETLFTPATDAAAGGDQAEEKVDPAGEHSLDKETINTLRAELNNLQEVLAISMKEGETQQAELDRLRQSVETAPPDRDEPVSGEDEDSLLRDTEKKAQENLEFQKLLESTLKERDNMAAELEKANDEVELLKQRISEQARSEHGRVEALQSQQEEIEVEKKQLHEKLTRLQQILDELDETNQQLQSQNLGLKEQVERLQNNLNEQKMKLMVRIKDLTVEWEALNQSNKEMSEKYRQLSLEIEEARDSLDFKEEEIRILQASMSSSISDSQLHQMQQKITELTENVNDVKKRAREMKAYYEDKITQIKQFDSPVVELTGGLSVNLNDLKRENTQLRQKIFSLENETRDNQDLVIQLRNKLAEGGRLSADSAFSDQSMPQSIALQELQDQITELEKSYASAQQTVSEKENLLERLQTQKFNRDKGVSALVNRLETVRRSIEVIARRKTNELIDTEFAELEKLIRSL